jgi:2-isopropylmalate synthase
VNIPDTVGYTVPAEFDQLFQYLKKNVSGIDDITLSVHCHNDLGMAVANSLAAVAAGARQIECTINGIGERAGNCSLEEIVMAIRTREEFFNLETGIDSTRLFPTARLVAAVIGMQIPRNKAIIGENAFAHEAGIHQHGMLQHHSTYEIMRPEEVGLSHTNLVLGKHSGRHAFRERVKDLGFELDEFETNRAFIEFKSLADKKKDMYDGDIEAIIMNVGNTSTGPWLLKSMQVSTGTDQAATATITLTDENDNEVTESAQASGPVEAAFQALECATGVNLVLRNFELHSATIGDDAQGEVTVTVDYHDQPHRGHAACVDIVEAGSRAYLEVINRILRRRARGLDVVAPEPDTNRAPI